MAKKYAIYGGSFDPIHKGHIALAESSVRELGLDRLIFMPAYVSPFKQDKKISSGTDRYEMIRSILHYNKAFALSDYEIEKAGPSYTINTLQHWDYLLDGKLYFVLGFDSVLEVEKWREGEKILRKYPLITARRPGADDDEGIAVIKRLREDYGANISILDMQPVDASSTEIRNRVHSGLSVSDMVMPEVEEYILEHNLYR